MGFFGIASSWIWLAGGILLLAAETTLPGVFLIWVGLAAIATGLVLFAVPMSGTMQLIIFAIFGLAAILLGHRIQQRQKTVATDSPFLNERGKSMIGHVYLLESAIVNGAGSVRIGDSVWRVTGADLAIGTKVKVIGVDGGTLMVEPA
jgi:membrane protein implicated in regulation of membrane protease activity